MKRLGNIFNDITSLDNLVAAEKKARKRKQHQYGVKMFDRNATANLRSLNSMLLNKTYKTSPYTTFKIYEPKEREVFRLPYFPDRIVHHAIMLRLEKMFVSSFTADTYSCIKGKGIHATSFALRKALKDKEATKYCLKLDIKKFYPNIDHAILKQLLRRKIKDKDALWLIDEIIDSAPGLPIGNYLSQYFANFYLTYFDHWIKEEKRVKNYFRYADDIVIVAGSKEELHKLLAEIKGYFSNNLKLEVKHNYQIFPVAARGIDFVGYVHFHECVYIRKSIKQRCARKIVAGANRSSLEAYMGWFKHANTKHLQKKLLNETIQRLRNKTRRNKKLRWREGKNEQDPQPNYHNSRFQNRAIQATRIRQ